MTSSPTIIRVPGNHLMVPLLGQHDELLQLIRDEYPTASIHVRGNEITLDGDGADGASPARELLRIGSADSAVDVDDLGRRQRRGDKRKKLWSWFSGKGGKDKNSASVIASVRVWSTSRRRAGVPAGFRRALPCLFE